MIRDANLYETFNRKYQKKNKAKGRTEIEQKIKNNHKINHNRAYGKAKTERIISSGTAQKQKMNEKQHQPNLEGI